MGTIEAFMTSSWTVEPNPAKKQTRQRKPSWTVLTRLMSTHGRTNFGQPEQASLFFAERDVCFSFEHKDWVKSIKMPIISLQFFRNKRKEKKRYFNAWSLRLRVMSANETIFWNVAGPTQSKSFSLAKAWRPLCEALTNYNYIEIGHANFCFYGSSSSGTTCVLWCRFSAHYDNIILQTTFK